MDTIRLTKEFTFEMSHFLEGYDGLCSQIHGHSYRLLVTVIGKPSTDPSDPKLGMVMDFGVMKKTVNSLVTDRFDHSFVMRRSAGSAALAAELSKRFDRIITFPFQPTCENLISHTAALLIPALPASIKLHSLRLHETATSYAEWFAEDNL